MAYQINSDRNTLFNVLPESSLDQDLWKDIDICWQSGNSKAALGGLQGRSIAIPNQGLLINSITLPEAKASSAIENI